MLPRFITILRNAGPQTLPGMVIILMYSQRDKTHQLLLSIFQYLQGAYKEAGEGLLARA